MKKFLILIFILLSVPCCLFANTSHHHRGDHIFNGNTAISGDKVGKVKKIENLKNPNSVSYDDNTFIVYEYYENEFIYSGCGHKGYEIDHAEAIRRASSKEVFMHYFIRVGIGVVLLVLCILSVWAESDSNNKYTYNPKFKHF